MHWTPPFDPQSIIYQEAIASQETEPATQLAAGLRQLQQRLGRRGVLILMSDFLVDDLESVFANLRLFRHRRWEVIVLHVIHPEEERLPQGSAYRFEGMEDDGNVDCSPADVARAYEQAFENHAATVRALSLAAGKFKSWPGPVRWRVSGNCWRRPKP